MRFNVGDVVIAKNDFSIKKEDGTDFFIKAGDAGIIEKTTTIRGIALYKVNLNDHILCINEQCLEATFRPIELLAGTRFSVHRISLPSSISKTQSIPAGEYEILDEKTLLDGAGNDKKIYWCRDIKGNIVMIMSDLLHYYITSGTASIVKAYTPKEEGPTKRGGRKIVDFKEKKALISKLQTEFNVATKEFDDSRTEYIAAANALKINETLQISKEENKEEEDVGQLEHLEEILAQVYAQRKPKN